MTVILEDFDTLEWECELIPLRDSPPWRISRGHFYWENGKPGYLQPGLFEEITYFHFRVVQ